MPKHLIILACICVTLTGCASSRTIQGPNGKEAHSIRCGSAVIEACYEEAAKLCPKGYTFLDRGGNPNAVVLPAGNGLMVARGPNQMLIECKGS